MRENDERLMAAAQRFADNMEKYPVEEQLAVTLISKNILNGCSWELVRSSGDFRKYLDSIKQNPDLDVKEITYSHKAKIPGYLIYMRLEKLISILQKEALGVFNQKALADAMNHRKEAVTSCAHLMDKGYNGRIGMFCTNDSKTITVDGKSYPAFALTLEELCSICENKGYGFMAGGKIRTPNEVRAHINAVIKACIVAPSSNAIFIDIAPMR